MTKMDGPSSLPKAQALHFRFWFMQIKDKRWLRLAQTISRFGFVSSEAFLLIRFLGELENRSRGRRIDAIGSAAVELFEEMNAFAARFAEEFASLYADCAEARAMIHPCHLRSHAKQDLKLCAPGRTLEGE